MNESIKIDVCLDCQGTGVSLDPRVVGGKMIEVSYIKCPSCGGTGVVTSVNPLAEDYCVCHTCQGVGYKSLPMKKEEIITHADNIRSMSDEELATFLCLSGWRMTEVEDCLEWLQRPSDELENKVSDSLVKCPSCDGDGCAQRPMTNLDFLQAISMDPSATAQFLVEWCQEKAWRKDAGAVEAWLLEPRYKDGAIREPK